ncbi:MAG TPA: murein biosynthesis integral membrane protein MurJ [Devosia sp.]|nr:murein biosynthesis integral membrane protein MurJ [Devosia sp.]
MSLYRNFFSVGAMTMLSRVLGFVRDIMLAGVLGTGLAADAFVAAFRFPNLFRRLFAEGAFNAAFIPLFAGALERKGQGEARKFAGRIISWLLLVLISLLVLAEIFMPAIMALFVPGFVADPVKFEFTVLLARICFPYLALMSLMAAFGAVLNGLGRFLAAAFAPVMLNVVLVLVLALLVLLSAGRGDAALILSVGIVFGGVAQVIIVLWALGRAGFMPDLRLPGWDRDIKRFWALALPAMLSGGITQINIFVGTIIASGASGAISYLYYADRLYQLPLGIIGIAIGVVLLPELSRHLKGNRFGEAEEAQNKSLLMAMLLAIPSAAALYVLASPIIQVLFQRGAFDTAATAATAAALSVFAFGLPAFVLIKVFQPGFFAREDTLTPTLLAAASVSLNIGLSLLLFPRYSHVGIAIATSASAWLNAMCLAGFLIRRGHFFLSGRQILHHLIIIFASVLMAFILWAGATVLAPAFSATTLPWLQFGALGALIGVGLYLYAALIHFCGVARMGELLAGFRR